jgi:sensor histidine kinase YesM
MKIRWRKHEFIIVSILILLAIIGDTLNVKNFTAPFLVNMGLIAFAQHHLGFSYFQNILLPQIAVLLVFYLVFLWFNRITVPVFLRSGKKKVTTYLTLILQGISLSYLLAIGVNLASYYAHPSYFNYGGFNLFAIFGYNEFPLRDIFLGFDHALIMVAFYGAYLSIREYIIYKIEHSKTERPFQTLVINQMSLLFVIYIVLPAVSLTFNLISNNFIYTVYFVFVSPTILVYLTLTYWVFLSVKAKLFNFSFILRLVLITFLFTFLYPLWGVATHIGSNRDLWLISWAVQLLVVSPLTWLLFQQHKDKIVQLKGLKNALVKSTADLQFLRSQINPHFLFNALNTLYGTALMEGSDKTAQGIQKLGDMMRFMLQENTMDFIGMDKEIEYLRNYISLQRLRIQTSTEISIEDDLSNACYRKRIAPMLLIPLVENAFKHGVSLTEKSWIKIKLGCDEQHVNFEVRNSVHPSANNDPEKNESGIGLQNVKERLLLVYPGKHSLLYGVNKNEFVANLSVQVN